MWSHYADKHRGICLEFDKGNDLIGSAMEVTYRKTYPEWTDPLAMPHLLDVLSTKSADWCYEREFRIFGVPLEGPLKIYDDDFVRLPDGALTAIIVGTASDCYDEVTRIVKAHAPSVLVKRAKKVHYSYSLAVED